MNENKLIDGINQNTIEIQANYELIIKLQKRIEELEKQ